MTTARLVRGRDGLPQEICGALGLKHVKSLDLHMAVDDVVTVTTEFYPEIDGVKQFPSILKKYGLYEINKASQTLSTVNLDVKNIVGSLTLDVELSGMKAFSWRLWAGKFIIKFAALVIGCKIEIETKHE